MEESERLQQQKKEAEPKTLEELKEWLHRLEQPRAGSIFDNHCELGMMYVLRKLLGKDTKDLEKQALKWRNIVFEKHYAKIDVANFKKGLVAELIKALDDSKVEILGMFAYQGPPSKNWLKTEGKYWEGWNKALDKAKKITELIV